jgi:hypothetical protein
LFRWNYAGLTRANYLLENKDKIDFVGKDVIVAEAKFLRTYYYFELVKFFGDVPLIIDKRIGIEEALALDRTPASEVYAQIETDLTEAAAVMSYTGLVKGHATKGAALSLLGKVYLYQNKFVDAASTFDQVIAEGGYSLIGDYSELFTAANENNTETVFDVEYSGLEGGGYGCYICLEGNAAPGFHGIRQYNGPVYGDGNSYNLPTQDLYDAFAATDPRRDLSILDLDAFIAAQPNAESISYAIGAGGHTGYYNNKYIKRIGEIGLPDNDLTSPVNYRVIRYADVLLMAAEAHYQTGNTGLAQQLVNQVRERAFGDNSQNYTSSEGTLDDAIFNERRLELAAEGHYFFDLVRTGRAKAAFDSYNSNYASGETRPAIQYTENKNEFLPIPLVELELANAIDRWGQNEGY